MADTTNSLNNIMFIRFFDITMKSLFSVTFTAYRKVGKTSGKYDFIAFI